MVRSTLFLLAFSAGPVFAQVSLAEPHYYLDVQERFQSYVFRTYSDPERLAWLLVDSAKDTWSKDPGHWAQTGEGYSYRFASGWGRRIVRNTAQFGFEAVLHEDSRYRPSGAHGFSKRFLFATGHSVTAYRPDGSIGPAYGRIAAGVAGAAISSTWHPQSIDACALLSGAGEAVLDRAGNNLLTEFAPDLKAFGKREWNRFRGK
jgi:hypothetical protein